MLGWRLRLQLRLARVVMHDKTGYKKWLFSMYLLLDMEVISETELRSAVYRFPTPLGGIYCVSLHHSVGNEDTRARQQQYQTRASD